ncbi:hypothetical protein [Marimonas lutisalis]|uniref:hypothetical protein n=1 Tax=Marimonas lutisalis TaxID=2545756 RepID=UPI0010F959C1|nr:hypothetical protein [Marimonas lutisalis]
MKPASILGTTAILALLALAPGAVSAARSVDGPEIRSFDAPAGMVLAQGGLADDMPGDDRGGRGRGRGADDGPGDDRGGRGRGADDGPGHDRGGRGRGADDGPGDDHGGRGRGGDDGPGDDHGGHGRGGDDHGGGHGGGHGGHGGDDGGGHGGGHGGHGGDDGGGHGGDHSSIAPLLPEPAFATLLPEVATRESFDVAKRGRSKSRIPGGSGCDDPHDLIEHPECRG